MFLKKRLIVLFLMVTVMKVNGEVIQQSDIDGVIKTLVSTHGEESRTRIENGVLQVASFWQGDDGSVDDFASFCSTFFIADSMKWIAVFQRLERNFEILLGHAHEVNRNLSMPLELDMGAVYPIDYLFAEYDPFAHFRSDMFRSKIAFVVLLNFPLVPLEEKLVKGGTWNREQWAFARLAELFSSRIPSEVVQARSKAYVQADDYIANYNIHMHNIVTSEGQRLFPENLVLITHWGLRDELKSQYAKSDGLVRQEMIYTIMQRIITQEIPAIVIDNENILWNPLENRVYRDDESVEFETEANVRYRKWLDVFKAEQLHDRYSPLWPSKIDRRFLRDREIPEQQVESLLTSVLENPVAFQTAELIAERLGRSLRPFDIWYDGFKSRSNINEKELDALVKKQYPTIEAFQNDIPRILRFLDFSDEKADYLASKITVDPSRGAGHATGAMRRDDNAHLRTRIPETGMTYKGYNIAIHELGHNVEQVLSLNEMDYYMLSGVPNNAFTEAFAFVFQSRDLPILGVARQDTLVEMYNVLDTYWSTCEIASVGLVDMRAWHWLYDHPNADAQEFKKAVIDIAREVWNQYWAPIMGVQDSIILAIYSHMIAYGLYIPDYALGQIIMYQIEQFLKDSNIGEQMESMCKLGRLTPDVWMTAAVGEPISAEPMIAGAKEALARLR